MRLGISATSWMRPNIFRNRLRPSEEVCCAIWSSQARRNGSPESPQVSMRRFWRSVTDNDGLCPGGIKFVFGIRLGTFQPALFQLDGRTCGFELLLDLLGLVFVDAFLDCLRSALDQVLGLLQAEARDRAHLFDHIDLLGAGRGQDDVELRLLLGNGCRSGACGHYGHG